MPKAIKQWVVRIMQDLTECSDFNENDDGPIDRVLREDFFDNKDAALRAFESYRSLNRVAGLAGQYVTYPSEVEIETQDENFSGRCEDFPCCGHNIGSCPTGPNKICPECGRNFEPTSENSKYCYPCSKRPAFFSQEERDDYYDRLDD